MVKSLCPSSQATTSSKLIGRVKADNSIAYLKEPMPLTKAFIDVAERGRPADERFRFASSCASGRCKNWKNSQCSLIGDLEEKLKAYVKNDPSLPECGIRESCRWFLQSGDAACRTCKFVTTQREVLVGDEAN